MIEALRELSQNGIAGNVLETIVEQLLENGCDDKHLVLIEALGIEALDAEESRYDGCVFELGNAEYLVLTESERDERWDECLESYLDEGCVEGADSPYFDREMWKRDARMDGAGHALSSYDGSEEEVNANGEWFFIYRTN